MPAPDSTTAPLQEDIRFSVVYANVYADITSGELEIGARVYRSPGAADERRVSHPCREGLVHVGVFPMSAVVPDSVRQSALVRGAATAVAVTDAPFDVPDSDPRDGLHPEPDPFAD